MHHKVIRNNVI